jgi:hypothetical protein
MVGNGYVTGSADPRFYQNKIKGLLDNPSSFASTPGYQFTRDQALEALNHQNSSIRGSGNAMAALLDRASGLASTGYDQALHTLGGLAGQEENYDLGLAGANNTAQGNANTLSLGTTRNANDLTLGLGANANTATRNANDLTLGLGANANNAQRTANDLTLGLGTNANAAQRTANDFSLGREQNALTGQRDWWNYDNTRSANQNEYSLGMYNAQTGRGAAESNAYLGDQASRRAWYSVYPRRVVAGG